MEEYLEKTLRMNDFYDILYAYTKEGTKLSNFQVLREKELNEDQELSICGENHRFLQNYASSSKRLTKLLQKNDLAGTDALLLGFIRITANIGANTIRVIALELKVAIKDTEEKSYTLILEEYEHHLDILLYDIREYIK